MTDSPDRLEMFRRGRLGPVAPPPAFAPVSDPQRLLSLVADALNQCERAGLIIDAGNGALSCKPGYVLPVGDSRLGNRWAVRMRVPADYILIEDDSSDDD